MNPFHLAIAVIDLQKTFTFYTDIIGCEVGRSDAHWIDLDFFGHQLVLHQSKTSDAELPKETNAVDGHQVPIPHFGVVLEWSVWKNLATKLRGHNIEFLIEPYIRFEGQVGEQATMFFYDCENNALEFKAFKNPDQLFAK